MYCLCHSAPPPGLFDWSVWLVLVMVTYLGGNEFVCVCECDAHTRGNTDMIKNYYIFIKFLLVLQFKFTTLYNLMF